jgi:hypothetical protein
MMTLYGFQSITGLVLLSRGGWGDNWLLAYRSGRPRHEGPGEFSFEAGYSGGEM